jgi:hypothetical protein
MVSRAQYIVPRRLPFRSFLLCVQRYLLPLLTFVRCRRLQLSASASTQSLLTMPLHHVASRTCRVLMGHTACPTKGRCRGVLYIEPAVSRRPRVTSSPSISSVPRFPQCWHPYHSVSSRLSRGVGLYSSQQQRSSQSISSFRTSAQHHDRFPSSVNRSPLASAFLLLAVTVA